jgi:hypothetical protein
MDGPSHHSADEILQRIVQLWQELQEIPGARNASSELSRQKSLNGEIHVLSAEYLTLVDRAKGIAAAAQVRDRGQDSR